MLQTYTYFSYLKSFSLSAV